MRKEVLMFLVMLFMALGVRAAWDGKVAEEYAGGDGTKANPYQIATAGQFAKLAADVNAGVSTYGIYFKMTADIRFYDDVMAISKSDLRAGGVFTNITMVGDYVSETDYKAFQGTFDGDGHTISGIYHFDYVSYMAPFRCIDKATIKNLGITDSYIFGNANTGGIAGYTKDSKIINCYLRDAMLDGHGSYGSGIASHCFGKVYIANCFFSSSVAIGTNAKGVIWGKNNLAGICARPSNETEIINCYCNSQMTPTKDNKAGLVSEAAEGARLTHCYYRDNVSAITKDNGAIIADVVGYSSASFKDGTVLNLLNENSINIPGACRWQYVDGSAPIFDYSIKTEEESVADPAEQANNPSPADGDMHAIHDNTLIALSWGAAVDGKTATQKIYLSDDKENLSSALVAEIGSETEITVNVKLNTMNVYYWRVDRITADGKLTEGNVWSFKPRQLAFIGAEGYGRFALGGRGGDVVYVTNLNNSGEGSFRYAATTAKGPRTIVFKVSGVIDLQGSDVVTTDNLTIAGQTAPGKGICFIHGSIGLKHDNICRFVRSARGGGKALPTDPNPNGVDTGGSLGFQYANNSIFDHCTARWGTDETYSSRASQNITFQRCIISEALGIAGHRKYAAGTNHGYAATIGGSIGSHHHNLLANCTGRNWSMGGGTDANGNAAGELDMFNNVVYNWTSRTTDGGARLMQFVGNYYKMGHGTRLTILFSADNELGGHRQQFAYVTGNIRENMDGSKVQDKIGETYRATGDYPDETWSDNPFFPSYAKVESAEEAYKSVLSDVGANMPVTDDTDARVIKETLTRTYTYTGSRSGIKGQIDEEADAGGFEVFPEEAYDDNFDTDLDGLPNWWENIHGTNVYSAFGDFTESNTDADGDGFTALEDYLDYKSVPNYLIAADETVEVDAAKLFMGYEKSPVYTIENANKDLQVTVDGSKVTAKASADNFVGEFTIKVTDADGHSYLRRVAVAVSTKEASAIEAACTTDAPLKSFEVLSMNGTIVKSGTCNLDDTYNTLPLDNLTSGVYLMRTTDINGKVKSYKVVKR